MIIEFRVIANHEAYKQLLTELGMDYCLVCKPHRVPCCAHTVAQINPRTKLELLAAAGLANMLSTEVLELAPLDKPEVVM